MEFLSESQLQLISNFRDRVRQSEQRLKDTLNPHINTSIPHTPESLPYITHGDVSKLSDTQYIQTEEQTSQIMNHNMTLGGMGSPPKKQLKTTIFNESPNGYADDEDSRIDNRLQKYNRELTDNNFDVSSDSDSSGSDSRMYSHNNNNLAAHHIPKKYQNKEQKNTNQNSSTISEREKLDENYKKHMGIPGIPPKSSSSRHRPEYSSRNKAMSSYDENDGLPSQSSHYYEGKLDDYLKSQDKRTQDLSTVHSKNLHEMNTTDIHYADDLRRLKVPSIKLFEQNQSAYTTSNRTKVNDSRGSDHYQENRVVLGNKDYKGSQKQKEKEKTNLKQDHSLDKPQQKNIKKAAPPSYPKKNKGEASHKERMSYQEKDVSNIENQNVNFQPQPSQERSKKSRSISARKENTGGAKTRSLSKDLRGGNKSQKKILARIINAETRIENERVALAKEMLRKYKLGTIDQNDLVKLLENQLAASPEFYQGLKELVHK